MEFRELAAFREVARQSSFSRAALRLGYVQSTVSAQVQALEWELGVPLFDRLGRTIALTPAGETLLPLADRLLELSVTAAAAAVSAMSPAEELGGTISLSAPESLLTYRLPAVLSRYRTEHPGVTVDLRPTPIGRFRGEPRRAVATGGVDLAFVLDTPLAIHGFSVVELVRESISVIAAPTHRLAAARSVGPKDLAGETLLLPETSDSGCAYRGQFERQLGAANVSWEGALEFASIETVKQCVVAGMGISVLPSVVVEADVIAERLVRLAWREPFDVYAQLVWNAHRALGPTAAAFIEAARAAFD